MSNAPAGLILCGGRSRRFGRDKALEPIAGRPSIRRVADALAPVVGRLFLVAGDAERYAYLGLPVIVDREPHAGPLAALAGALDRAGASTLVVAGCDMPFITSAYFRMLLDTIGDADACMPRFGKLVAPLAAVYRDRVAVPARALRAEGRNRLLDLLPLISVAAIGPERLAAYPPELLSNLNTPEQAARAAALLEQPR